MGSIFFDTSKNRLSLVWGCLIPRPHSRAQNTHLHAQEEAGDEAKLGLGSRAKARARKGGSKYYVTGLPANNSRRVLRADTTLHHTKLTRAQVIPHV